jgi:hypothetical protein
VERLLKLFEDMRAFLMNIYSFAARFGAGETKSLEPTSLVFSVAICVSDDCGRASRTARQNLKTQGTLRITG